MSMRYFRTIAKPILWVVLFAGAWVLSVYLQLFPVPLMRALLIAGTFFGLNGLSRNPASRKEIAAFSLFSCPVSAALIIGQHIHVEDIYSGTLTQNYMTPFSLADAAALFLLIPVLTVLFLALYRCILRAPAVNLNRPVSPFHTKHLLFTFGALVLCYLPYLLLYWPGVILNDTLSSIDQALGFAPLVHHHPVPYTLFIKLCLQLGEALFSSRTIGYALYTTSQMLFVSAVLACMIDWLSRRTHSFVRIALTALFSLTPYFAVYSVAGWKDPIFSVCVAALSVFLLRSTLKPRLSLRSGLLYALLLIIIVFSRTNGVGILALVALWQFARYLLTKKRVCRMLSGIAVAVAALYFIVTGPVYDRAGIATDKREANALVLQQMARVAALDGDMSESDRAFLNEMLPLDLYKEVYRPCCVDLLKWHEQFDASCVSSDMYKHWLSLFIQNPVTYAEAWVLNTFGFWTLNVPEINSAEWNLSRGVVRNKLDPQYIANTHAQYGIEMKNLLGYDTLRDILTTDEWFIPLGWIFWGCAFLFICLCLKGQSSLLDALIPTFGLMLPIILVTPIAYWMRYGAALHDLLPMYLLLFCAKDENH